LDLIEQRHRFPLTPRYIDAKPNLVTGIVIISEA